jgi:hypothetical protein
MKESPLKRVLSPSKHKSTKKENFSGVIFESISSSKPSRVEQQAKDGKSENYNQINEGPNYDAEISHHLNNESIIVMLNNEGNLDKPNNAPSSQQDY